MVFDYLCHACGSCSIACKFSAIFEVPKTIGVIKFGTIMENIEFVEGIISIGEPSPVRIIREVKKHINTKANINILDCPPGTSHPVVESLQGVDFAVLVTEPTPFGLHDLKRIVLTVNHFKISIGVVINKYGLTSHKLHKLRIFVLQKV